MPQNSRQPWSLSTRARRWLAGSALLTAGAAGGGYLATTATAGAATVSNSGSTGSSSSGAVSTTRPAPANGAPHGLDQSGTVSAVGSASVTITASSGTATTYTVVANSDIDKNGEAALSNLAVGDKVTFDYVTSGTTKTIAHLHAGNEALDRPTADGGGAGSGELPGGGPGGAPQGGYGGPTSSSGSAGPAA